MTVSGSGSGTDSVSRVHRSEVVAPPRPCWVVDDYDDRWAGYVRLWQLRGDGWWGTVEWSTGVAENRGRVRRGSHLSVSGDRLAGSSSTATATSPIERCHRSAVASKCFERLIHSDVPHLSQCALGLLDLDPAVQGDLKLFGQHRCLSDGACLQHPDRGDVGQRLHDPGVGALDVAGILAKDVQHGR